MAVFVSILLSVLFISAISLVGVITLAFNKKLLDKLMLVFLAFTSGSLLGAVFFHMLPEAVESGGAKIFNLVLWGILGFFIIERFIHWHHCGKDECKVRPVAYLNLIGDGIHNFIDGVVIAAAYLTSIPTGIIATLAIAFHEIPQEFGDFCVLLHFGFTRKKALFYNFVSATMAIFGAVVGYLFLSGLKDVIPSVIAFASGGFIYIATADLMPELHAEGEFAKIIRQTLALLLGVAVMYAVSIILP